MCSQYTTLLEKYAMLFNNFSRVSSEKCNIIIERETRIYPRYTPSSASPKNVIVKSEICFTNLHKNVDRTLDCSTETI